MLPLENFGHCRLPLAFSCHCITIIFCFKKSYFSFNYGTGQNKHNTLRVCVGPLKRDVPGLEAIVLNLDQYKEHAERLAHQLCVLVFNTAHDQALYVSQWHS